MFENLHSVLRSLRASRRSRPVAGVNRQRRALTLEGLEERTVLSTASSITANLNGTAIPAGDTLWFNSAFQASGLPKTGSVTIHAENQAISFTSGGTQYSVAVPNGVIVLTAGATTASASYDPTDNDWDVSAPASGAGDVFMGGVALAVPNGLPGGIKNVTWTGDFWSDTPNVAVNWKWAASVYKSFSTDYNALNVKPVDSNTASAYRNGDQSDTPEAFKSFLVAGGTGGGGNNYTGNYTPNMKVSPTLGDGLQDYPYPSSNPLTSIAFNESTVLKAANLDTVNGYFQVWYSDEHALALGVGQVIVKTSSGTTTTNYDIAQMTSNPSAAFEPAVGSTYTTGNQAGTDVSGRPMAPSLYITDITNDPNSRTGDWQWGGTAISPDAVFGTWKSFTRTVDTTTATPTVTVGTGTDPAKNNWNLGTGSDAPPAGLTNEGYGAEIRWNINSLLTPGHTYRFYVMVHDGDQNKVGGDAGQAVFNYYYPAPPAPPASSSLSGYVYADANANGVKDSGDSGLGGWTVILTGTDSLGNTVNLTTTTNADGSYSFKGLAAGTYQVAVQGSKFNPAPSATDVGTVGGLTNGTVGSNGSIGSITLKAGDKGVDYDFAELVVA
jgi:hypothetical protein